MFNQGWWGLLWFVIKLWMFMFCFVWLRGSLPRVRYDQFMRFGWKFLIPITLLWVVAVAFIRGAQLAFFGENTRAATLVVVSVISVLALAVAWVWDGRREDRRKDGVAPCPEEIDPFEGGYPVPPLPGQRLLEPSLRERSSLEPAGQPVGQTELTDQETTRG
jgi:NADH-quinone oxidoreductase subunit H